MKAPYAFGLDKYLAANGLTPLIPKNSIVMGENYEVGYSSDGMLEFQEANPDNMTYPLYLQNAFTRDLQLIYNGYMNGNLPINNAELAHNAMKAIDSVAYSRLLSLCSTVMVRFIERETTNADAITIAIGKSHPEGDENYYQLCDNIKKYKAGLSGNAMCDTIGNLVSKTCEPFFNGRRVFFVRLRQAQRMAARLCKGQKIFCSAEKRKRPVPDVCF